MNDNKKLGVIALAGVVISAMLGGGVYNLPQNMAQSASARCNINILDNNWDRNLVHS